MGPIENRRASARQASRMQQREQASPPRNKRKMSEATESRAKRNALGDISNQNVARVAAKKSSQSGESSQRSCQSSQPSQPSQPSQRKQSSQNNRLKSESTEDVLKSEKTTEGILASDAGPSVSQPSTAGSSIIEPITQSTEQTVEPEPEASVPIAASQAAPVNSNSVIAENKLNWHDIDKENEHDIFQSPEYAVDIFKYYSSKEAESMVDDYMTRQVEITSAMRAVLVDWMVEVQENFELNHETLYLAVRLVDHYLSKRHCTREAIQLIGAAAIFIGCKFDERIPPLVDDFLYICDDAYTRSEFVLMEKDILRVVDFNLGMPISYRFLRRFAKAGKKTMQVLTLARYINETALMYYSALKYKESLVAAGCLRLAMKMSEPDSPWSDTLVHYSGYTETDLVDITKHLNNLMRNRASNLKTVYNKYCHSVFFEVAKRPLLKTESLYKDPPATYV